MLLIIKENVTWKNIIAVKTLRTAWDIYLLIKKEAPTYFGDQLVKTTIFVIYLVTMTIDL